MSGLEEPLYNQEDKDNDESVLSKLKNFWYSLPFWLRILLVCALVIVIIAIIVLVVYKHKKQESFKTKIKKPTSVKSKEGFINLNNIDENSYVRTYIQSTRGEMI